MNPIDKKTIIVDMRDANGVQELLDLINVLNSKLDTKKMTMVEIGSYAGQSTVIFAKYFKKVIAVDPFLENYDPKDETCRRAPLSTLVYERFKENTKKYQNIEHVKMTSDEAVDSIGKIDFVYIDGCHTYEQVVKDIEHYLPKIKKTSFIGGHDFIDSKVIEVKRAVLEKLGVPDHVFACGSWLKEIKNIKK